MLARTHIEGSAQLGNMSTVPRLLKKAVQQGRSE